MLQFISIRRSLFMCSLTPFPVYYVGLSEHLFFFFFTWLDETTLTHWGETQSIFFRAIVQQLINCVAFLFTFSAVGIVGEVHSSFVFSFSTNTGDFLRVFFLFQPFYPFLLSPPLSLINRQPYIYYFFLIESNQRCPIVSNHPFPFLLILPSYQPISKSRLGSRES